ncbi:MAG: hypothetical protein WBB37_03275 [bacterium]
MKKIFPFIFILLLILACGKKVMVPPRIDLSDYEVVGIIEFSCSEKGKLGSLATNRFMEFARRDQGMIRIIELGTESEVLKKIGHDKLDREAFTKIGETYEIATVFTGELIVSDVRPDIMITPGLGYMGFGAEVDATLSAQMVETVTGASIWNNSGSATRSVGHVSIFGGKAFAFDAEDPDKAYGKLVNELVDRVTADFQVTWRRE